MHFRLSMFLALACPASAYAACPGTTQLEMNQCAFEEYQRADAQLNATWTNAKAYMDGLGAGDILLDAQRKWLAFRDAACASEVAPFQGGSIRPLVHATCLTRLTQRRTQDLAEFTRY
ncbi:MAG: lysozyme inhibitor LprI family protein [Pseudomonadota bacterium]